VPLAKNDLSQVARKAKTNGHPIAATN